MQAEPASAMVERLRKAVEDHDLDAIVSCFTPDYRNETPAHPGRGFQGSDQVRDNWARILSAVPDVSARVLRTAVDGEEIWSEWELRGTRTDGATHLLRGVIIFGVEGERARWARFFLEPVDAGAGGVDAAVGRLVDPGATA